MDENIIVRLEKAGVVTATFRRLDTLKKEKIFRATLSAFAADTFDRVSLDNISLKADVSKGSLIQYFALKENLLLFVSEIVFDNYQTFLEEYFAAEEPVRVRERLNQFINSHISYWIKNPDEFRFIVKMIYENINPLSSDFVNGFFEILKERISIIIKCGIERGEIKRNANIDSVSGLILASFSDIMCQAAHSNRELKADDINRRFNIYLNLIFEGIKTGAY